MAKPKLIDFAIPAEQIEQAIHVVRGQRVMLDVDLTRLYGVSTAALNQAVKRKADRFPEDFAYQLTQQEFTALMSQNVISKAGRGGRTKRPWAFTEHGVAMLSSVLKSPTAARVNIAIMPDLCPTASADGHPRGANRTTDQVEGDRPASRRADQCHYSGPSTTHATSSDRAQETHRFPRARAAQ
jgi:hypothetical protein